MTTVSLQTVAALFGGEDTLIAPVITKSAEDGTSILSFVLTAEGEIPEDGLIVTVNSNIQFRDYFAFLAERPFIIGGELVGAVFNDAGEATGFQFKMTESKALINLRPMDNSDAVSNDQVTFTLQPSDEYDIDASAGSSTVTFYETLAAVPTPSVTPAVSLSVDTSTLNEVTGNSATLTFRLSEPPPPEGVLIYVQGDTVAGFDSGTPLLSEFDLFNATVTGGAFPAPDGFANGFFFKVTEQVATLTLAAFKDDDLEGLKDITLSLQEAPGYTIANNAGSVTLNLVDDATSQIQVSLNTEPAVLIESEKTVSIHNFTLSATPPAEGLIVSVVAPNINEFDLAGIKTEGGTIARVTPTGFDFQITAKNATIELPVANDGTAEGIEDATFTLQDASTYQLNPEALTGKFQIVDTPDQASVLAVNEPNDTIEKAVNTNLSTTNNKTSFTSTLDFSFRNSYENADGSTLYIDGSEDVDFYKVTLKAGDRIYIDTDSNQFEEGRKVDTWLRVFDRTGTALASNDDGPAPDEVFNARFESYIEFTAPTDGDYYVGVSLYGNGQYDPNKPGSGGGSSSNDENDYGTGEYTLNIHLNESPLATPTPIPLGDRTGPAISLFSVVGTYGDDFDNLGFDIQATGLAETTPEGSGSALNLVLTAEGEIPDGGIKVFISSDVDLTQYFGGVEPGDYSVAYGGNLNNKPFTRGGQFLEAVYDAMGNPTGFTFLLEQSFATIVLNPSNREEAETDGVETATFSIVESRGYTVSNFSDSTVSFYDTIDQIPVPNQTPEVSLELSTTELIESEETQLTLTLRLSEAPPPGGVQVYVSGNAQDFLNEFGIFAAEFSGGVAVADGAVSGFYLQMFEQTATITLPVFNSTDITEGIEAFDLSLRPGVGYTVNAAKNGGTIQIKDNPDSQIQVSVSTEPEVLIETEGTIAKVNFSLSATPPSEGVLITVNALEMLEFDPKSLTAAGGELVSASPDNTSFTFRINEKNASVSVAIADDGTAEGVETATFTVEAGDGYQVNPEASSGTFTIVDTPDQAPSATTESNDTLDTAIATGLSATNRSVSFDGEIGEHSIELSPDESITIDSTEDVDLYKVDLTAGQDLIIDVDATELGSKLQFAQIRVFDANGQEVVKTGGNSFQAAADEVFSVFNDPYLEFTAASAGTYYVGISQIGNDFYDPTVAGSGSGWIFPSADILPDKYTLNLTVSPQIIIDPPPITGDETLYGTSADETLDGQDGNDTLYGNGGRDTLIGGDGNDLIYGSSQADTISGGTGDDIIYANGGGDAIDSGIGMDTVWLGAGKATIALNAGEGYVTVKNFQLGMTQFTGGGTGLSFADSSDGVKISKGDDLLAIVSWQTASTFSQNASAIFV
ncbi:MAG: peptidase [Cyanobacteria bacterium CRU_2_1]|nr:peptidase [Cyanobacteria bacterium CRU_2_1]